MADYTAFFSTHSFKHTSQISCLIKEGSLIRHLITLRRKDEFLNGELYLKYLAINTIIKKFSEISSHSHDSNDSFRLCIDNEEMVSCFNGFNSRNYKDIIYDMRRIINSFAGSKDFAIIDTRELKELISLEFLDFIILKKSKISNRDILDGIWRTQQKSKSHLEEHLGEWMTISDNDIMNQNLNTGA